MIYYILAASGAIIFFAGYRYMSQHQKSQKKLRIPGLITYLGLCLLALGCTEAADPLLQKLIGDATEITKLAIEAAVFIIGAERILKPAFEKEESEKEKSRTRITPMGTVHTTDSSKKKRSGSRKKK